MVLHACDVDRALVTEKKLSERATRHDRYLSRDGPRGETLAAKIAKPHREASLDGIDFRSIWDKSDNQTATNQTTTDTKTRNGT